MRSYTINRACHSRVHRVWKINIKALLRDHLVKALLISAMFEISGFLLSSHKISLLCTTKHMFYNGWNVTEIWF